MGRDGHTPIGKLRIENKENVNKAPHIYIYKPMYILFIYIYIYTHTHTHTELCIERVVPALRKKNFHGYAKEG